MNTAQISFLGEEVKVEPKAKKFEFLLNQLQAIIEDKDKEIDMLKNRLDNLLKDNKDMREKIQHPKVLAIDCFKVPRNGVKTNLNYFLGLVRHEMFMSDKTNDFDDNKKALYKEMWNDIIVPTYKDYMKYHGEEQDAK